MRGNETTVSFFRVVKKLFYYFFLDLDAKNAIPTSGPSRNPLGAWCSDADSSCLCPGCTSWTHNDFWRMLPGPESSVYHLSPVSVSKDRQAPWQTACIVTPDTAEKRCKFLVVKKYTEKATPHVFSPLPFSAKLRNVFPHRCFPTGPTAHLPDTEILAENRSVSLSITDELIKAQEVEISHPS